MDDYHEQLGEIAGYILASDDQILSSQQFSNENHTYKGYRAYRSNSVIQITIPHNSGYINVEVSVRLSQRLQNALGEDTLEHLKSEYETDIGQSVSNGEVVDLHLRNSLPNIEDDGTKAALHEIQESIDDPDVRLEWQTYSDTQLVDGFIVFTRLFPDSLSLQEYDAAVNQIDYYAPMIDDEFTNAFGEFVEDLQDDAEESPTGGDEKQEPESTGRGFA